MMFGVIGRLPGGKRFIQRGPIMSRGEPFELHVVDPAETDQADGPSVCQG